MNTNLPLSYQHGMRENSTNQVLLEICVGSVSDACAAEAGGADRVELCGSLELGGLTPSLGLVEQVVAAIELPVMVMIRPRAGGFCYSESDFLCMLRDAELALAAGAQGIVFGALDQDSCVDSEKVRHLVDVAGSRDAVFHRAFDFASNQLVSLETLIDLKLTRLLTTGGKTTAVKGIESLTLLRKHAAGRIDIMPGGGVSEANVAQIITETRCTQVHSGATVSNLDLSLTQEASASLCDLQRLSSGEFRAVDGNSVGRIKAAALGYE